jgi:hypothetical protein
MIPMPDRLALKLLIGVGCVLLLALLVHDRNRWKSKTSHYSELLAGERTAHALTIANYRAAAERARHADERNSARVRSAQAAISERIAHDFEGRITAARSIASRLRGAAETATANSGARRATPVPGLPTPAGGTVEATAADRLPQSDALIATEQAIQLDELIKWVRKQAEVSVNEAAD